MKRVSIKVLSMMIFMLTIVFVNDIDVYATSGVNIQPSDSGVIGSCGSFGNCISLGTAGMRVSIVDKNGKIKGKTVDYWFFYSAGDKYYFPTLSFKNISKQNNYFVYYKGKKSKIDVVNGKQGKLIIENEKNKTYTQNTMSDFKKYGDILAGFNASAVQDGSSWRYPGSEKNPATNVRHPNLANTIVKERIYKNIKNKKGQGWMSVIFKDTGAENSGDLYLQFEPLVAWQMYLPGYPNIQNQSYTFFGTITEFSRLMNDKKRLPDCYDPGYGNNIGYSYGVFHSASCNGLYQIVNSGIFIDNNDKPSNINKVSGDCNLTPGRCYQMNLSKNGYGVGYISLRDLVTGPLCVDEVVNKIKNPSKSKIGAIYDNLSKNKKFSKAQKDEFAWMSEASKFGFTNDYDLQNYVSKTNSCAKPSCDYIGYTFATKYLKSKKTNTDKTNYINNLKANSVTNKKCFSGNSIKASTDGCNRLDPELLDLYGSSIISNSLSCASIDCQTTVDKIGSPWDKNKLKKVWEYWLKHDYSSSDLARLVDDNWKNLGDSKPTCKKVNDCKANTSGGGYCGGGVSFTDSDDWKNCLNEGIAYSTSGLALSYDSSLSGTCNSKVYCKETVSFDLPTTPSQVKAGRVFKWGIVSSGSRFGKMTVTRQCKASSCSASSINPRYWTSGINTDITIHYKEPISNDDNKPPTKENITSTIYAKLDSITVNNKPFDVSKYSYECKGNCLSNLITSAVYYFNYGNDLKWYANKKENNQLESYKSSFDHPDNKPYYTLIGYGLPTYFKTPTVTHSIKKGTNGYNWAKTKTKNLGDGYLYLEIDKIGTKNNGVYHFSPLVTTKTGDAYQNGKFQYACDYSVKNELFGYECIDKDDDPLYCDRDKSPKGIDVVFRTIELVNANASSAEKSEQIKRAFPGRSGSGREIGRNWATLSDEEIIKILRNTVYSSPKEPMYKITLDASTITSIRNENREIRKNTDPYTYISNNTVGVENSGYNCTKKDGDKYSYCVSTFVQKMMKKSRCVKRTNKKKPCE